MWRSGLKTYAGYTRYQDCGIYDSDPRWCDLSGMRKGKPRPLDRKGRGSACGGQIRKQTLGPVRRCAARPRKKCYWIRALLKPR